MGNPATNGGEFEPKATKIRSENTHEDIDPIMAAVYAGARAIMAAVYAGAIVAAVQEVFPC